MARKSEHVGDHMICSDMRLFYNSGPHLRGIRNTGQTWLKWVKTRLGIQAVTTQISNLIDVMGTVLVSFDITHFFQNIVFCV